MTSWKIHENLKMHFLLKMVIDCFQGLFHIKVLILSNRKVLMENPTWEVEVQLGRLRDFFLSDKHQLTLPMVHCYFLKKKKSAEI